MALLDPDQENRSGAKACATVQQGSQKSTRRGAHRTEQVGNESAWHKPTWQHSREREPRLHKTFKRRHHEDL